MPGEDMLEEMLAEDAEAALQRERPVLERGGRKKRREKKSTRKQERKPETTAHPKTTEDEYRAWSERTFEPQVGREAEEQEMRESGIAEIREQIAETGYDYEDNFMENWIPEAEKPKEKAKSKAGGGGFLKKIGNVGGLFKKGLLWFVVGITAAVIAIKEGGAALYNKIMGTEEKKPK